MNERELDMFVDHVAVTIHGCIRSGYNEWRNLSADFSVPSVIANGEYTLKISGHIFADEKRFIVYAVGEGRKNQITVYSNSERISDLKAAVRNVLMIAAGHDEIIMKKGSKFRKGGPILTLDVLMNQEYVFHHDKVVHRGWFQNWNLRYASYMVGEKGCLYYAVKNEG